MSKNIKLFINKIVKKYKTHLIIGGLVIIAGVVAFYSLYPWYSKFDGDFKRVIEISRNNDSVKLITTEGSIDYITDDNKNNFSHFYKYLSDGSKEEVYEEDFLQALDNYVTIKYNDEGGILYCEDKTNDDLETTETTDTFIISGIPNKVIYVTLSGSEPKSKSIFINTKTCDVSTTDNKGVEYKLNPNTKLEIKTEGLDSDSFASILSSLNNTLTQVYSY